MSKSDFLISDLFDLHSELKNITNFLIVGIADNQELEELSNQHLLNTSKSLCDLLEDIQNKINSKELLLVTQCLESGLYDSVLDS